MNLLNTTRASEPDNVPETSMAMVASALADPSRVSILCALMDGRAWTATELSVVAGIAASTASGHLNRLLSSGLVICLMQGRHRYYSLAGHHIAGLLENLMGVSMWTTKAPFPVRRFICVMPAPAMTIWPASLLSIFMTLCSGKNGWKQRARN